MRDQKYQNVTLFKRRRGIVALASALTGWRAYFLFSMFAVLRLYLVGVGAIDDPHGRGINTYAKHVCWRRHLEPSSWSCKSTIREKVSLSIFHRGADPYKIKIQV